MVKTLRLCAIPTVFVLVLLLMLVGVFRSAHIPQANAASAAGGTWQFTGAMHIARDQFTATMLQNGEILVAGGVVAQKHFLTRTAELYNPTTGQWTLTGSMDYARFTHAAVLLPNGEVLVVGGEGSDGGRLKKLASAEIYNPTTGMWSSTGNMHIGRSDLTATLLPNGKVLVAGGFTNAGVTETAELYDPTVGTWSLTGSMNVARYSHTATLLPNGEVLVAGGGRDTPILKVNASTELYNPTTGTWAFTGKMHVARYEHTATLLNNGEVLVAGGTGSSLNGTNSAELYDPTIGVWSMTGNLNTARFEHSAALLNNGEVLVAGGVNSGFTIYLKSAELYDPTTGMWSTTGNMHVARNQDIAILLSNGQVLVAGGGSVIPLAMKSAELYTPT